MSQDVPWAEMTVRIVGARTERDSAPHSYSATQIYAELDLAITNDGQDEVDYNDRNTRDLILADGTRVRSENAVGVLISSTDTAKATLRYPVSQGTSLAGSFLELNGSDRGKLEPEQIPLDAKWQGRYPIELDSLRGGQVKQPEPFDSSLELRILDARVDLNDPEGRAPVGMKFVHLDMKASVGGSPQNIFSDYFRIIVDGSSFAPVNDINLLPAGNTTTTFEVLFTVPSDTTKLEIQITPGGDVSMRFAADLTKNAHMAGADGDAGASDAGS